MTPFHPAPRYPKRASGAWRIASTVLAVLVLAGCVDVPTNPVGTGPASPSDVAIASLSAPPATSASPSPSEGSWPPSDSPTAAPTVRPMPAPTPLRTPRHSPLPTPRPTPVPTHSPSPTGLPPGPTPTGAPTLADLVGQKLVIRMDGPTPSADLLGRITRGEIGGVILFGANITTPYALTTLTAQLQAAARSGGRPPLLIATDQEGGVINRVPWAPPTMSAWDMGIDGSPSLARSHGAAAGSALAAAGINVDLAPVADVPSSTSSFMYIERRVWSFSETTTSYLANAFAGGLEASGVVPVMKHFPGLGYANQNTDSHVVTIGASRVELAPGMTPYRSAIRPTIPVVMVSNAIYAAYDASNGAGWSPAILQTLLRQGLGFAGVTMTDSLTGAAVAHGDTQEHLAVLAATAGADMLLVTGDEASTRLAYSALLAAASKGSIPMGDLQASYDRVLALKAGF